MEVFQVYEGYWDGGHVYAIQSRTKTKRRPQCTLLKIVLESAETDQGIICTPNFSAALIVSENARFIWHRDYLARLPLASFPWGPPSFLAVTGDDYYRLLGTGSHFPDSLWFGVTAVWCAATKRLAINRTIVSRTSQHSCRPFRAFTASLDVVHLRIDKKMQQFLQDLVIRLVKKLWTGMWDVESPWVPWPGITCRLRVGNLIIGYGGGNGGNSLWTGTTAEVA